MTATGEGNEIRGKPIDGLSAGRLPWSPAPGWVRDGVVLFLLLVACRAMVLLGIAAATGQREFTMDGPGLRRVADDPTSILRGEEKDSAHPPLMPVASAALARPLARIVPTFLVMRTAYVGYELIAFAPFWLAACLVCGRDARARRLLGAAFVLSPAGWVTTAVMSQEESIGGLVMLTAVYLALTGRLTASAFACGVGVVGAKIFFLVPLLAVVVAPPFRGLWRRALAGGLPVLAVYAVVIWNRSQQGQGLPLRDFAPRAPFGMSFWTPLLDNWPGLSSHLVRSLSGATSLVAGLAILLAARRGGGVVDARGVADGPRVARVMLAMTLAVFLLFYHIVPEYYLIVAGSMFVLAQRRGALLAANLLFALAWGINFFYGVWLATAAGATPTSNVFVRVYRTFSSADPKAWEYACLFAAVAVNVALTAAFVRAATRPSPVARPSP